MQHQGKTIGLSFVVMFIINLLGITTAIGKSFKAKLAIMLIVARIVSQSSRLQALRWSKNEDKILDLLKFTSSQKDKLNDKTIYQGLDYIYDNQEIIENKLFKSYYKNNPPKRVYYDVTSSYVVGLLTDEDGHAISIHTYPGNTNDISTFVDQLNKLKNRFNLEGITIVGDGGMIKSEDIYKIKELGYDYITSIGKPSIKKLIDNKESKIQMSLFDEELQEVIENDVRYILRQNPIRRDEIGTNRDDKIKRFEELIQSKKEYYNTHYKAKKETLEKYIDKKISDLKLSKFISYNIIYKDGYITTTKDKDGNELTKTKEIATIEIIIDQKTKQEASKLDGCYVVTTSLTDTTKNTKENIHQAYKTLIKVENAFKTLKTEFLEIRPLYLRTDSRIIGHIALSMHAYNITLELKKYIKQTELDFKSTIRELSNVQTISNKINDLIEFETIPTIGENLQKLFTKMNLKLPARL